MKRILKFFVKHVKNESDNENKDFENKRSRNNSIITLLLDIS